MSTYRPDVKNYFKYHPLYAVGSLLFAMVPLFILTCCSSTRRSFPWNFILLTIFSVLQGFAIATLTCAFNNEVVIMAFVMCAAAVLAVSLLSTLPCVSTLTWTWTPSKKRGEKKGSRRWKRSSFARLLLFNSSSFDDEFLSFHSLMAPKTACHDHVVGRDKVWITATCSPGGPNVHGIRNLYHVQVYVHVHEATSHALLNFWCHHFHACKWRS